MPIGLPPASFASLGTVTDDCSKAAAAADSGRVAATKAEEAARALAHHCHCQGTWWHSGTDGADALEAAEHEAATAAKDR
jgi:hypothetical protein